MRNLAGRGVVQLRFGDSPIGTVKIQGHRCQQRLVECALALLGDPLGFFEIRLVRKERRGTQRQQQARERRGHARMPPYPFAQPGDRASTLGRDPKPVDKPPQVLSHLLRRLIAAVRILLQRRQANRLQVDRHPPIHLPRRPRLLVHDLGDHLVAVLGGERPLQRQQFIKRRAQRTNVGAAIQRRLRPAACDLFGAHVCRRADEFAGHGHAGLFQHPRQAEIVHAQAAIRPQHQIRRFDVAMNDAALVRMVERVGDVRNHLGDVIEIRGARTQGRRAIAGGSRRGVCDIGSGGRQILRLRWYGRAGQFLRSAGNGFTHLPEHAIQ